MAPERRRAKEVVDETNSLLADVLGYHVDLVGWEDTVSLFGRPQAIINRELERCELFIGLIWRRWGTPPSVDGPFTSGFEEEFELSVARRKRDGRPEISLFFKRLEDSALQDPGEQLQKVVAFKKRIADQKLLLFEEFGDDAFEAKFRRCLVSYLVSLGTTQRTQETGQDQSRSEAHPRQRSTQGPVASLAGERLSFVQNFVLNAESRGVDYSPNAADIARFRLVSTIFHAQGNDDLVVAVHDANLLYKERERFQFDHDELRGMLNCGLEHYEHENVPLWHWLAEQNGFDQGLLQAYSIARASSERQISALRAMTLLAMPLPLESRTYTIGAWLDAQTSDAIKAAALAYLAKCGLPADIPAIRIEFDRSNRQTSQPATEAILSIALRDSREKAIASLYELQPATVPSYLVSAIFQNGETLGQELLEEGSKHICATVRRYCIRLLRARKILTIELAERLKEDPDSSTRYEVLVSLVELGSRFSDEEAKHILVKKLEGSSLAWLFSDASSSGESFLESFKRTQLQARSDDEIETMARNEQTLSRDAKFTREERHFERWGEGLRRAVDDEYRTEVADIVKYCEEKLSAHPDLIEKVKGAADGLRDKFTLQGTEILCRRRDRSDLVRVRNIVRRMRATDVDGAIDYIRACGEWDDISLLIDVLNPKETTAAVRAPRLEARHYRAVAKVIYRLGKARLDEVLAMPAPSRLLCHIVVEMADGAFRKLDSQTITNLLQSDDESLRRLSAVKCVRALSKSALVKYLKTHLLEEKTYYNIVHWLDFGIAAPREQAEAAAKWVLENYARG